MVFWTLFLFSQRVCVFSSEKSLVSLNCCFHIDGSQGDGRDCLPCLPFYLPTYPAGYLSLSFSLSLLEGWANASCVLQRVKVLWMYLQTGFTLVYLCFGVCMCIHECDTQLLVWDALNVVICIPSSTLIKLLYSALLHLFSSSIRECVYFDTSHWICA